MKSFSWSDFEYVVTYLVRSGELGYIVPENWEPDEGEPEMSIGAAAKLLILIQNLSVDKENRILTLQEALLDASSTLKATDPRDQVYGLLDLTMSGDDTLELISDYTKSVREVYTDTTRYLMMKTESLDLMRRAGLTKDVMAFLAMCLISIFHARASVSTI